MGKKRRSYSREFKLEAVRLVKEEEQSLAQVARDLGIHESALWRWKKQFEDDPEHAFPGKGNLSGPEAELARLRRENENLRMERDILKKAIGIFSKMPK